MAIIQSSTSSDSLIIDPTAKAARVTLYDINGNVISFTGAGSSFTSTFPSTGTAAGYSDGTNMQSARVFDTDSGSGTEYVLGVSIRLPNNGGSIPGGTSLNPLRIDPTGSTIQPVSGSISVSNFPVTQPISGSITVSNFPATQPISGSVAVSNFPATQPVSAVSLPLPSGAATSGNQSTAITLLNGGLPAALGAGGALKVDASSTTTLPLPTNASTNMGEDSTNGLRPVAIKPLSTSTYSPSVFTDFGANVTLNVKASAGNVFSLLCQNLNTSMRWLQIHNTATTPSSGATPVVSIPIPGTATAVIGTDYFTLGGFNFSTGIAFAFSTTSATYTAGSAADQMTQIAYK